LELDLIRVAYLFSSFLAAAVWIYYVSHGFKVDGLIDGVYDIQAASLASGHLHIEPGPLKVFYDDTLMYFGQYYFYWGLLPSLLLLGLSTLIGRLAAHYAIVSSCFFSIIYFYHLILDEILDCSLSGQTKGRTALRLSLIIVALTLIFVIPYPVDPVEAPGFFSRFTVYEQQVLFGLALAMPGTYLLIRSLEQKHIGKLAAAALVFALAASTRVTWFPFAGILWIAVLFLVRKWTKGISPRLLAKKWGWTVGPSLVVLCLIMYVNYVRFDSPFDFGVRHQNPGDYLYFRNLKLYFSPLTKFWNVIFNLASYYAPPQVVGNLGLYRLGFSYCEGFPPSFFYFNPYFLPLVVLFPLGLYWATRSRSRLLIPFAVLSVVVIYLHVIIGLFGTMVILRYFVEFYYFLALLFLIILLMLTRPWYAVPLFFVLLVIHFPFAAQVPSQVTASGSGKSEPARGWPARAFYSFLNVQPELRLAEVKDRHQIKYLAGSTPFLEPKAKWAQGTLTSRELPHLPRYAVMGASSAGPEGILGNDLFAAYLIPRDGPTELSSPELIIRGLRSLQEKGVARIFVENRLVGSQDLSPNQSVNFSAKLPFSLPVFGPYQIMLVFLPQGSAYLSCRAPSRPAVLFQEIVLERPGPEKAAKSLLPEPTQKSETYNAQ